MRAAALTGRSGTGPPPGAGGRCARYGARVSLEPERIDVPVTGGTLAAYRWPGDEPVVLAAHGISSNHRTWGVVAGALEGAATLVAPDLRGRGRSNGLPGPYTIAQHAEDCLAVL